MKCENCETNHDGTYGSGRFCTSKCARGFSTKGKRSLINEKVSKKLIGSVPHNKGIVSELTLKKEIECPYCKEIFMQKHYKQKLCSRKCQRQYRTEESKIKISLKAKERVANGTHSGWQTRNVRSYAEKFFETVLNNNKLTYSVEKVIKKRDLGIDSDANYFLDFYFEDIKLDLEIDGKQHEYEDRIIADKERDGLLSKIGIQVYRIKWKNPNTEKNKEYMKEHINKFLLFYKILKSANYICSCSVTG